MAVAAVVSMPSATFADPTETKPEATTSDPDYAAGKLAYERARAQARR